MIATTRRALNVIVVVWNDSEQIPAFYDRARATLERLADVEWRLVFVNNASGDDTLARLLDLRASDDRVKIVTLSRNFGYHAGLIAGLSTTAADLYAMVDVDCEDPPELLADLYDRIRGGSQLAYGVRSDRDEAWLMTQGRRLFYIVNSLLADSAMVMWMGEFSMMTRQVRDAIIAAQTTFPFLRAEMSYVGFQPVGLPYRRARRGLGRSHYSAWRLMQFAVAGILSGTTFPLRFVLYLSVVLGAALPVAAVGLRLSLDDVARIAVVAAFYHLLLTTSIISLYLARTYRNVVARPVFVVDQSRTYL
jgi:dolichol-phosphate mannosyltransferase